MTFYKSLSEENIRGLRRKSYESQIKDFCTEHNPFLQEPALEGIIDTLITSNTSKLKSETALDLLSDSYKGQSRKTDKWLIELKNTLGVRFDLKYDDLSLTKKLIYAFTKSPLSERTLVRESKYFYEALTNKKVETAYYPFCYTDTTKIYPEISEVSKIIAVDTSKPGIKGKNIVSYISDASNTNFIKSNSVQLSIITPGTPVCGINLPFFIDKKFKPELERILDSPGLLVLPKAFILSRGGDQKDYRIPREQQEILDYYKSIGQKVIETGNFAVIKK